MVAKKELMLGNSNISKYLNNYAVVLLMHMLGLLDILESEFSESRNGRNGRTCVRL